MGLGTTRGHWRILRGCLAGRTLWKWYWNHVLNQPYGTLQVLYCGNAIQQQCSRACLRDTPMPPSIHSNLFVKHEGTSSFINPQRGDHCGSSSQLITHFLRPYSLLSSLLLSRFLVPLRSWPRLNVYILTARIIPALLQDSRPPFCRPCSWRQVTRNKSAFDEWATIDLPSDVTWINPRLLFQVRGSGYVRTGWNRRWTGRVFGCEKSMLLLVDYSHQFTGAARGEGWKYMTTEDRVPFTIPKECLTCVSMNRTEGKEGKEGKEGILHSWSYTHQCLRRC